MTQSNLVDQAKQGDPQAIATLMNRSLQPKGILAQVSREGDRLRIYLEAEQVPNREALMTFVQNGVSNLRIDNISVVEVIGQQIGQDEAVWTQEWQLDPAEAETGIEFVSRGDPEVVVLQRNQPPVPPPRPIPPPAPPRPLAFSEPAQAELDDLDLNDDELSSIREGLSGLSYPPLESEPSPTTSADNIHGLEPFDFGGGPEEDELPPELLAAEVARQIQQDIPPDLLLDEDAETATSNFDLTDEAIGVAQFSSVNDLALSNGLYTEDDLLLEENGLLLEENGLLLEDNDLLLEENDLLSEENDLLLEDSDLLPEENDLLLEENDLLLEENDLLLEDEQFDVEEPLLEESEFDPNLFLEDDYSDLETDELPPPPPPPPQMAITPSPDMDAGDDLQITYLDEDEDMVVTQIEPETSLSEGDILITTDNEAPQGQMIGSPIAIQPIHPQGGDEDDSRGSGVGLWVWLVAFFLIGWIGALIGLSIWSDRPGKTPNPQPQAEQVRSV